MDDVYAPIARELAFDPAAEAVLAAVIAEHHPGADDPTTYLQETAGGWVPMGFAGPDGDLLPVADTLVRYGLIDKHAFGAHGWLLSPTPRGRAYSAWCQQQSQLP